jgi:hypothetical protein
MKPMDLAEVSAGEGDSADSADAFRESFEVFYRRELKLVVGLAYVLSGSRTGAEETADVHGPVARLWDQRRESSLDMVRRDSSLPHPATSNVDA